MQVRTSAFLLYMFWLMAVAASFCANYHVASEDRAREALGVAQSFFEQVLITRQWNAGHGGVYVFVSADNQPNPYLVCPDRDLLVNGNRTMTKINPAYMTRQLSEIAQQGRGIRFHLTSLDPLRPQNAPTSRERELLQRFEGGLSEAGSFVEGSGGTEFFYMAPLRTEKSCLRCHAVQGYKEGDVRGGLSVTVPVRQSLPLRALILSHSGIGLIGVLGILLVSRKLDASYTSIQRQAVFDALTDIPNRRSFADTFRRECDRSGRGGYALTLIMCDIDNFKAYNDAHGHDAGDVCLRRVAQAIQGALSRPGDFCARFGGEEFAVILGATELMGGVQVAERVRAAIEALGIAHGVSGASELVTISLGVATMKQGGGDTCAALLGRADAALYQAKREGRNRVAVSPD